MIYISPAVRLVNHCFTACTSRTIRTGRAKKKMPLYGSYQFVYIGHPSQVTAILTSYMKSKFGIRKKIQKRGIKNLAGQEFWTGSFSKLGRKIVRASPKRCKIEVMSFPCMKVLKLEFLTCLRVVCRKVPNELKRKAFLSIL